MLLARINKPQQQPKPFIRRFVTYVFLCSIDAQRMIIVAKNYDKYGVSQLICQTCDSHQKKSIYFFYHLLHQIGLLPFQFPSNTNTLKIIEERKLKITCKNKQQQNLPNDEITWFWTPPTFPVISIISIILNKNPRSFRVGNINSCVCVCFG